MTDDFIENLFKQIGGEGAQVITAGSPTELFSKLREAISADQPDISTQELLDAWTPDEALVQALQATLGAQKCFAKGCQDENCYGFKERQADRWIALAGALEDRRDRTEELSKSAEEVRWLDRFDELVNEGGLDNSQAATQVRNEKRAERTKAEPETQK